MPKYVIERDVPGAGQLSQGGLRGISQKSREVLEEPGPQIQWVESCVTDDRISCVYLAPDADLIRPHAEKGGFPADRVSAVHSTISPLTAEG